eukprot:101183_1
MAAMKKGELEIIENTYQNKAIHPIVCIYMINLVPNVFIEHSETKTPKWAQFNQCTWAQRGDLCVGTKFDVSHFKTLFIGSVITITQSNGTQATIICCDLDGTLLRYMMMYSLSEF